MAEDWKTQKFRQSVISKINELLQKTGQNLGKDAIAIESHFFNKSQSREDYFGMVAKLHKHLMVKKPLQQPSNNADMNMPIQNPLNALQNLASQGNRNPQMMPIQNSQNASGSSVAASNLLQSLNQQRPGQQISGISGNMPVAFNVASGSGQATHIVGGQSQQIVPQMSGHMNPGMQMNAMTARQTQLIGAGQQMVNAIPTQLAGGGITQMQRGTGQILDQTNGGGGLSANSMVPQQLTKIQQLNQMNMGMSHPHLNQMMNPQMVGQGESITMNRNSAPPNMQHTSAGLALQMVSAQKGQKISGAGQPATLNQMLDVPPRAGLPMIPANQMFSMNRGASNQQQFLRQSPSPNNSHPSPAGIGIVQQPTIASPQMVPSPSLIPHSSPQMLAVNSQWNLRQSPNGPLNTPGQVGGNSPFNSQEDILYREKFRQLTKYIEPLKRMVAKIGNDGANTEKITKMSKLLDLLINPAQRVPLETLLKCEKALEKMEIVSYTGQQFGKTSNPLLDVINNTTQATVANHTFHRTFRQPLSTLFDTDILCPVAPKKPRMMEEVDIPHVLQGEIARLGEKFKLSLDTNVNIHSKTLKIVCHLDDKRLPSVPPMYVTIPESYPSVSPEGLLCEHEYMALTFFESVMCAMRGHMSKLPKSFSITHLLHSWELAVRQACAPDHKLLHHNIDEKVEI